MVDDSELDRLTIADLEALEVQIKNAVRAAIRTKQRAKLAEPLAMLKPVDQSRKRARPLAQLETTKTRVLGAAPMPQ